MSRALLQAWRKTLRRHGAERAVTEAAGGRSVSFRELDGLADAWRAAHVPDPGALAGRAVVFARTNGVGWWEIFLGLLKAGAVAVPLDPGEPVAAQRRLAADLRAGFWWDGARLRRPDGEDNPTAGPAVPPHRGSRRYRDPAVCLIKLTSGSTGRPRALVFTDAQMLADGRQVTQSMGITARDLNYALIPCGHSYGLGNLTIPLLAHGVPLVCGSAALPQAIADDFARWRPTVFPGVPTMWRALAASEVALASLRLGISAGAPLAPEVARDFAARFGRRLHSFYGSSETGGITYDRGGHAALAGTVGTAMRGVKLTALPGQRLRVRSAAVVTYGRAGSRRTDGAWLMPDRAAIGARGEVTLLGRRGTTVKVAGRRVNLADVAGRLCRLPGVRDAWVDVSGTTDPVLAAVVATDQTAAELRAALAPTTAAWLIPKKLLAVAALPVTARGKVDASRLREMVR
jgi:acyl-CoA synthetase (AMP-forming)/AMP-acid ligase II